MAHAHTPSETTDRGNEKRLLQAFIVTAGFMLVEAIGGVVSGSLALLADAGHMLTDSSALLFALLAVRFAAVHPIPSHLRLAASDHAGGLRQRHCAGCDYHSDCLGSNSTL